MDVKLILVHNFVYHSFFKFLFRILVLVTNFTTRFTKPLRFNKTLAAMNETMNRNFLCFLS